MSIEILPINGGLSTVNGFYCDGVSAGLRPTGAPDVAFIYSDTLCDIEALFTSNRFQSATIKHFKGYGDFQTNFVLVNAKNANALTGQAGLEAIDSLLTDLQKHFTEIVNPVMSSTGIIGVPLPKDKILAAAKRFDLSRRDGATFAEAIMTTDKYPKQIALKVTLEDGQQFTIAAAAKGAGMIDPAMATMLCFIITDADVPKADMRPMLEQHVRTTFNAISVDGDTSTNDTVMLLANKKSGVYDAEAFSQALHQVMQYLALQIVSDGEGATKMVAFNVSGAKDDREAEIAAKALADSLLVKTALFGEDPNWGRIASTIGACGIECSEDSLNIRFEDVAMYLSGEVMFDKSVEALAAEVMTRASFTIYCELGIGDGHFTAYGCDLGHEYVKVNADYRT